jgi:hypothetical protein
LTVDSIIPACSCTTVAVKKDGKKSPYFGHKGLPPEWYLQLGAGESAEVEVVFDPASGGVKGKTVREVSFQTSDPLDPLPMIKVQADVEEK